MVINYGRNVNTVPVPVELKTYKGWEHFMMDDLKGFHYTTHDTRKCPVGKVVARVLTSVSEKGSGSTDLYDSDRSFDGLPRCSDVTRYVLRRFRYGSKEVTEVEVYEGNCCPDTRVERTSLSVSLGDGTARHDGRPTSGSCDPSLRGSRDEYAGIEGVLRIEV